MAIKSLTFKNFKNFNNFSMNFHQNNDISGPNGAGKSGVADAIAFVYGGTDSHGNVKPLHLIQFGADKCEVTLDNGKAQICRTLTRKGSTNIKLIKNGVSNKIDQKFLNTQLGSTHTILSAIFPGYFSKLKKSDQQMVLGEISPEIDEGAVLEELVGIGDLDHYNINLARKPTLIISDIAAKRRTCEQKVAEKQGQIDLLLKTDLPPEPVKPADAYKTKGDQAILIDAEKDYKDKLTKYTKAVERNQGVEAENKKILEKRDLLEKELDALVFLDEVEKVNYSDKIRELGSQKQMAPANPILKTEVESAVCPTCAQPISLKLREQVKLYNKQKTDEVNRTAALIADDNKLIDDQIKDLYNIEKSNSDKVADIDAKNKDIDTRRRRIQRELSDLHTAEKMATEEPVKPSVAPDYATLDNANKQVEAYDKDKVIYDDRVSSLTKATGDAEALQEEQVNLKESISKHRKIEQGLKDLPNVLLEKSKASWSVDGLSMVMGEKGLDITVPGYMGVEDFPYSALSTGNKFRVDMLISLKINEIMKKPIGLLFMEDADVLDSFLCPVMVQTFSAVSSTPGSQLVVEKIDKTIPLDALLPKTSVSIEPPKPLAAPEPPQDEGLSNAIV